ncbi:MAG: transposase [Thermogutta sp.]
MRRIREAVLPMAASDEDLPKTVREYRAKYKGVSHILDEHHEVLEAVHEDLKKLSQGGRKGRSGDFTSETILRALVVHAIEGLSLRETVVRIAESEFLQDFLRTRKRAVMDHSFLDRCLQAIRPATWKRVNELLGQKAVAEHKIGTATIRTDTTVVETNIHWPTDASLLWDTWRVASRLLKRGREIVPESCPHRFHDRKSKGLYLLITRYAKSPSKKRQRKVKGAFRALIERVEWIVEIADMFCQFAPGWGELELLAVADELKRYLRPMSKVIVQARRSQLQGEKVPACERVFSIFEPHTELIKRGRREKPVEFGHAMLLCQTPEKFITDYEVFAERPADCTLTGQVIERHEKLFGQRPEVLAADKGFCPDAEAYAALEKQVGTLAIPRRMRDFADKVLRAWQAFRAGIEGTISGLKRAFRLARCFYRGFKHFQGAIGLGVFAHNLVVLANQGMT